MLNIVDCRNICEDTQKDRLREEKIQYIVLHYILLPCNTKEKDLAYKVIKSVKQMLQKYKENYTFDYVIFNDVKYNFDNNIYSFNDEEKYYAWYSGIHPTSGKQIHNGNIVNISIYDVIDTKDYIEFRTNNRTIENTLSEKTITAITKLIKYLMRKYNINRKNIIDINTVNINRSDLLFSNKNNLKFFCRKLYYRLGQIA